MLNTQVSSIFREIAQALEIKGDNLFRIRAYERAAQNITGLSEDLENLIQQDRLTDIPGIGVDLADKIKEFAKSGKIKMYEDLKQSIPQGLLELLKIPSVGPKTAKLLYEELKIKDIAGLESVIRSNKLQGIFGIKEKTVENISKGIALYKKGRERLSLAEATALTQMFLEGLAKLPEIKHIAAAGSLRRQKETVRDIDILVSSSQPRKVMEAFVQIDAVKEVLAKGDTKASVRTQDDVQVDCRVVKQDSFGAALLYFTGSKNFNIKLRALAQKKGLKINEYGVFRGNHYLAGRTEQEIFKLLSLDYIEPELREDRGEIELAQKAGLPDLIQAADLKGDLHIHSNWSDGGNSILEMAEACRSKGYSYVAIADHSQGLRVAGGLSLSDLKKKRQEIGRINKKFKDLRVLYATEVDIGSNGGLDYPEVVLREFDLVVAAIHTGFKQSQKQLTRRIIKACENKNVHIIAHPTGRLWGTRDAYQIDLEQILKVARQNNTFLEINSFPQRLDLNDLDCRRAKEAGVRLAISTDAHTLGQLEAIKFGISVARRGWLSKEDVINTLEVDDLLKILKK